MRLKLYKLFFKNNSKKLLKIKMNFKILKICKLGLFKKILFL